MKDTVCLNLPYPSPFKTHVHKLLKSLPNYFGFINDGKTYIYSNLVRMNSFIVKNDLA